MELWRFRLPASPLMPTGLVAWLKRLWAGPALLQLLWRRQRLLWRGVQLAPTAAVSVIELHGRGRNLLIGDYCSIGKVYIQAHDAVTIGACVTINDGVSLLTGTHHPDSETYAFAHRPIRIGDYVWIATRAMVLPGVCIGRGAIVGAGAVVTRDVAPFVKVAGNPARPIGTRAQKEYTYKPAFWFGPVSAWVGRQF